MITMSKTLTPELTLEVLDRLEDYAAVFRDDFSHKKQALWSGIYLQGLLHDGERKSIEPLSGRVELPPDLHVKDPEQALQQLVEFRGHHTQFRGCSARTGNEDELV